MSGSAGQNRRLSDARQHDPNKKSQLVQTSTIMPIMPDWQNCQRTPQIGSDRVGVRNYTWRNWQMS